MENKHHLRKLAKSLRRRQTDAEKKLWYYLRNRQMEGEKFRRQEQIENYIVDFVCFEKKVIVELDGGQHNEPFYKAKDEERTRELMKKHYIILRYWDNDVLQNTDGVLENIRQTIIRKSHPHLTSPVKGEE